MISNFNGVIVTAVSLVDNEILINFIHITRT